MGDRRVRRGYDDRLSLGFQSERRPKQKKRIVLLSASGWLGIQKAEEKTGKGED